MKKFTAIIFFFFITLNGFSQNLNGQWRGYFDSRGDILLSGNNSTEFVLELDINGTDVSGYSYSYFQDRKYYVICSLEGTYNKASKSIKVTETKRIKGNTPPDFTDCLQVHYLTYQKEGKEEILTGRWEEAPDQAGGGCGTGKTTLSRRTLSRDLSSFNKAKKEKPVEKKIVSANTTKKTQASPLVKKSTQPLVKNTQKAKVLPPLAKNNPELKEIPKAKVEVEHMDTYTPTEKIVPVELNFEKRKSSLLKTIQIENDTFKVDLYDNGEIDGDSVSLFYNGKLILSHKRLTDKPISLTLNSSTGKSFNELTMYADNLGTIPPNTALMVVTDGDKRYEVRISSDLKNSGTINFVHKPNTQ